MGYHYQLQNDISWKCPAVGGSEELLQWKAQGSRDQNLGWVKAQQLEESEWQFSGDDTYPLDWLERPPLHLRASPCIVWDKAQSMLIKSPSFKGKMVQLNPPDPSTSLLPSSWLQHPILPASHNKSWLYYPYDSGTSKENYSFCWLFDFVPKITVCFYFWKVFIILYTQHTHSYSLKSGFRMQIIQTLILERLSKMLSPKRIFLFASLKLLIEFCVSHRIHFPYKNQFFNGWILSKKKKTRKNHWATIHVSEGTTRIKTKRPKIVNTSQERGWTVDKDLFPTQSFLFSLGEECKLEAKWLEEESNI